MQKRIEKGIKKDKKSMQEVEFDFFMRIRSGFLFRILRGLISLGSGFIYFGWFMVFLRRRL
jgi:hypothetical protein